MSTIHEQYVVFSINENLYGIPILDVSEIIRIKNVKWLPDSKEDFLGTLHFREKEIQVVSLHRILSEKENIVNEKTRVIVVPVKEKELGFVVDQVNQAMFLPQDLISPPPHLSQSEWVTGVYHDEEKMITLLNIVPLFKSCT